MSERETEAFDEWGNHAGEARIEKRKAPLKKTDWLAVGAAAASILTTLGSWAWYGGKLSQRMDTIENDRKDDRREIDELRRDNARQDVSISVTGQQYTDIIRRLDGIDRKLDDREAGRR